MYTLLLCTLFAIALQGFQVRGQKSYQDKNDKGILSASGDFPKNGLSSTAGEFDRKKRSTAPNDGDVIVMNEFVPLPSLGSPGNGLNTGLSQPNEDTLRLDDYSEPITTTTRPDDYNEPITTTTRPDYYSRPIGSAPNPVFQVTAPRPRPTSDSPWHNRPPLHGKPKPPHHKPQPQQGGFLWNSRPWK